MPRRLISWFARHGYLLAVLAIAVSTALFLPGRDTFANGQWALLYLLLVVLVAGASGAAPAVAGRGAGLLRLGLLLSAALSHPDGARAEGLAVARSPFSSVGVVMGVQTGRMRDREARALAREHETAALNRLSAGLVSQASTGEMAETILGEIVDLLGAASATLFVGDDEGLTTMLRHAPADEPDSATTGGSLGLCQRRAGRPVARATALVRPGRSPPSEGFGARGQRRRLFAAAQRDRRGGRPERRRPGRTSAPTTTTQSACWPRSPTSWPPSSNGSSCRAWRPRPRPCAKRTASKSSLLSSVPTSSDAARRPYGDGQQPARGRCPLERKERARRAASDRLRRRPPQQQHRGAARPVAPRGRRLGAPPRAVRAPRDPGREPRRAARPPARPGDHHAARRLPPPRVDFVQCVRVFQNLLENAMLYAGAGQPGRRAGHRAVGAIWVQDEGPGVPADEHEAVFEKFFRGLRTGVKAPSGTGLGLAITREIVRPTAVLSASKTSRPTGRAS